MRLPTPSEFLADECGATVEWVLLTASLVGLALAVITLIGDGAETLTTDMNETIEEADLTNPTF